MPTVVDAIIDPVINAIAGSLGVDALAGLDPSAGLDVGSVALPAADAALASDPVAARGRPRIGWSVRQPIQWQLLIRWPRAR